AEDPGRRLDPAAHARRRRRPRHGRGRRPPAARRGPGPHPGVGARERPPARPRPGRGHPDRPARGGRRHLLDERRQADAGPGLPGADRPRNRRRSPHGGGGLMTISLDVTRDAPRIDPRAVLARTTPHPTARATVAPTLPVSLPALGTVA